MKIIAKFELALIFVLLEATASTKIKSNITNLHDETLQSRSTLQPFELPEDNWSHPWELQENNTTSLQQSNGSPSSRQNMNATTRAGEESSYQSFTLPIIVIFAIIGIIDNGLVVAVVASDSSLREKATNFLIMNQSIVDATICILVLTSNLVGLPFEGLNGVSGLLTC